MYGIAKLSLLLPDTMIFPLYNGMPAGFPKSGFLNVTLAHS